MLKPIIPTRLARRGQSECQQLHSHLVRVGRELLRRVSLAKLTHATIYVLSVYVILESMADGIRYNALVMRFLMPDLPMSSLNYTHILRLSGDYLVHGYLRR